MNDDSWGAFIKALEFRIADRVGLVPGLGTGFNRHLPRELVYAAALDPAKMTEVRHVVS